MTEDSFARFFERAAGFKPYPYQSRLATGTEDGKTREEVPCGSRLIHVPTGAGKTEAVILAWLWNRVHRKREDWPRRLVYCLPMRVLVEQTRDRAHKILENLVKNDLLTKDQVSVHILMGGEVDDDWDRYPERNVILIGTQDMLLSRALNRGYAMSRFRWPMDFAWLNNDCLWVMDEVQLMGSGLPTSAQLAAFRKTFGVLGSCHTLWMSATLGKEWLKTADFDPPEETFALAGEDKADQRLKARLHAKKMLRASSAKIRAATKKSYAGDVAADVLSLHQPGTLTLVVANTVERAREIYGALKGMDGATTGRRKRNASPPQAAGPRPDIRLFHSRFRPAERQVWRDLLRPDAQIPEVGRILVSTQVIEAGVDVSARLLFTELAPWASIVQRFGRCNRYGESDGQVFWADIETDKQEGFALPYESDELRKARKVLRELEGRSVAPENLPGVEQPFEPSHMLRRRDLVELFDTTPDLSGNDVDVSRFIRDGRELDALVFWRNLLNGAPAEDLQPSRDELCPVPFYGVAEFVKDRKRGWRWDHLDRTWAPVRGEEVRPGQIVLLDAKSGGYSAETGWDPRFKAPVTDISDSKGFPGEGVASDPHTFPGYWQTLKGHSNRIVTKAEELLKGLSNVQLAGEMGGALLLAARYHDAGKAHHVFQTTLSKGLDGEARRLREEGLWAKSANRMARHGRPHFRHELASALCLLQNLRVLGSLPEDARNLALYLVAAHHGRVRLAIRSLPGEKEPGDGKRFALGVWDGDRLPENGSDIDFGSGFVLPRTTLNLSTMEMGQGSNGEPSWLERMLALRNRRDLGPFRLAYLEALLRAADWRASADPGDEGVDRRA